MNMFYKAGVVDHLPTGQPLVLDTPDDNQLQVGGITYVVSEAMSHQEILVNNETGDVYVQSNKGYDHFHFKTESSFYPMAKKMLKGGLDIEIKAMQKAKALVEKGKYGEAILIYLKIDKPEAAKALDKLGQTDKAREMLMAIAQNEGLNSYYRLDAADYLYERWSDENAALTTYRNIAANSSKTDPDRLVHAQVAERLKDFGFIDEAVKIYTDIYRDTEVRYFYRDTIPGILISWGKGDVLNIDFSNSDLCDCIGDRDVSFVENTSLSVSDRLRVVGCLETEEAATGIILSKEIIENVTLPFSERIEAGKYLVQWGESESVLGKYQEFMKDEKINSSDLVRMASVLIDMEEKALAIKACQTALANPSPNSSSGLLAADYLKNLEEVDLAVNGLMDLAKRPQLYSGFRLDAADRLLGWGYPEKANEAYLLMAQDQSMDEQQRLQAADYIRRNDSEENAIKAYKNIADDSRIVSGIRLQAIDSLFAINPEDEDVVKLYQEIADNKWGIKDRLYALNRLRRIPGIDTDLIIKSYLDIRKKVEGLSDHQFLRRVDTEMAAMKLPFSI